MLFIPSFYWFVYTELPWENSDIPDIPISSGTYISAFYVLAMYTKLSNVQMYLCTYVRTYI